MYNDHIFQAIPSRKILHQWIALVDLVSLDEAKNAKQSGNKEIQMEVKVSRFRRRSTPVPSEEILTHNHSNDFSVLLQDRFFLTQLLKKNGEYVELHDAFESLLQEHNQHT